ncbi:multimerin-2 [Echinops telfairi]|uniref:Multimerin-2 n=1 Tax=Echinops telfairi TaxID=9371 RepID=A0ABM1VKT9_ECHTE|nr:multimerin-2 [Echinops telfairi]
MVLTLLLGLSGALGWGLLGACAQAPGASFPGPHIAGWSETWDVAAEDTTGAPDRRNWCPYQKSRLVTFVAACRTEKFLIHSQQPCPQGAPDCQRVKVMYRLAYKPVYQVKQKVLGSVVWRCCPGYMGPDCLDYDPTALPASADPKNGLQEALEGPVSSEPVHQPTGISQAAVQQEHPMAELQNDLHHVADSLLEQQGGPSSSLTVATAEEANQTELGAIVSTQRSLERHQRLFHSLFENFQGLLAANSSIDLGKLQARLTRKRKTQHRATQTQTRHKKEVEPWADPAGRGRALATKLMEAGSPVAFYAGCSEGTTALQTMKFNTTYVNIGSNYFPEHGYFRAPERGVYLFAVSIDFGPGPGSGQLVIGGHHRTPVYTAGEQTGGSTAVTFAVAELQKGERVWFEVTQGLVTKRNPPSSTFGGFLIFKT